MSQEPHLLEKHAAYESLANHLSELPKKLVLPGLIPIAPRIYLPGELIRTNEILVLLGRSGEASYFAERTAWQAQQIVRRRLGHIEQGLRELLVGVGEVPVRERLPSKQRKRVTFREPVVCASPPLKACPCPNPTTSVSSNLKDNRDGDKESLSQTADSAIRDRAGRSLASNFSTKREVSKKVNGSQNGNHTYDPVVDFPQQYLDVLRAAELDEDSSEDDFEEEYANYVDDDYNQFLSKSSDTGDVSELSTTSKPLYENEQDSFSSHTSIQNCTEDAEPKSKPRGDKQDSVREGKQDSERHSVKLELEEVLRKAEKQAKEDDVVNLTEYYEDESATPSGVTMPPNFQPDKSIDFDDDAEEYLDMTGRSAKAVKNKISTPSNHLEFLREEARKEEDEERKKAAILNLSEADRRRETLEKEKKEFGTGFAKGFFEGPSKESKISKEQNVDSIPVPLIRNPEVSELQETGAVEEKVVERQRPRKSSRRHRKPRMTVMPEVMSVAESQQESNVREDERAGRFAKIEDIAETEDSHMSKFRQLQKLKRASSDNSSDR